MPIDLNMASVEELLRAGMDAERARYLVDYGDEHGRFRTWDDVKSVPGFSQKLIETLKENGAFFNSGQGDRAA